MEILRIGLLKYGSYLSSGPTAGETAGGSVGRLYIVPGRAWFVKTAWFGSNRPQYIAVRVVNANAQRHLPVQGVRGATVARVVGAEGHFDFVEDPIVDLSGMDEASCALGVAMASAALSRASGATAKTPLCGPSSKP